MSGNRVSQEQKAVVNLNADNARRLDGQTETHEAQQKGAGSPHPFEGRILSPDGEIRDPLGNFSEQVGAYFG